MPRRRAFGMLAFLLSAWAVASCSNFDEGYILTGSVADSVTGLPVDSVRVQIGLEFEGGVDSLWCEFTDEHGRFTIRFAPDYVFDLTKDGYVSKRAHATDAARPLVGGYSLGVMLAPKTRSPD